MSRVTINEMENQKSHAKLRPTLQLLLALGVLSLGARAWTKVEFDSSQLVMKNADQISELVRTKIKKAQEIQAKQEEPEDGEFLAEREAVEELKAALRIVLARPDQDGTRGNAFARLRRELVDLNSLDAALGDLISEALSAIKSTGTKPGRAATYIILLENLMAEIKPESKTVASFKKMIEEIRDANIEVSDEVKNQQLIRAMNKPVSPSLTAAKIFPKDSGAKK